MHALLFRRLEIDGVNYYQLYGEEMEFTPDDTFANYENRYSKDAFYIDVDTFSDLPDLTLYDIYYDVDGKISVLNDSSVFEKVFSIFCKKFNIAIRRIKSVQEIVDSVEKKILFQREAIGDLTNQIYLNQSIMASDLPVDLKLKLKNNILFHGVYGSGKKSIIESLEDELNIPFADVTISTNVKETLEDIIRQLLSRAHNDEEASHGIVFIRDNFLKLVEVFADNVYTAPLFFTEQGPISYGGRVIDFRTLTFVILLDERIDMPLERTDIDSIMTMTDCTFKLSTRILTDDEKYEVLRSQNGRLTLYDKFLNKYGFKMVIEDESVKKLISECSKADPGMNLLNTIIDGLVKENLLFGVHDVYIDESSILPFLPAIDAFTDEYYERPVVSDTKKEEIHDLVFDEELEKVSKKVIEDVVGQDKQVKSVLYTILENRRMINKDNIDNPKQYMTNILIRGESGSGKTMIIEKIAKLLNIPTFIADSTQYTETGWAGESVSDMLVGLYNAAGCDLEAAQKGILFIDEVDKKATTDSHGGPSRGAVLDNLLKSIEGAKVAINIGSKIQEEKIMFDTSRLTVICSGAFEGIEEYRDKRIGKRRAGFDREIKQEVDQGVTVDDYIAFGMNRQFMSRLPKVIELNKFTKESLIRVMKESNSSKLKIEKFKLEDRGIEVEYTEDFYDRLAEVALKKKTGARGIEQALSTVLESINIENIRSSDVSKIIFNKDVVDNPNNLILIEKSKQKKLTR